MAYMIGDRSEQTHRHGDAHDEGRVGCHLLSFRSAMHGSATMDEDERILRRLDTVTLLAGFAPTRDALHAATWELPPVLAHIRSIVRGFSRAHREEFICDAYQVGERAFDISGARSGDVSEEARILLDAASQGTIKLFSPVGIIKAQDLDRPTTVVPSNHTFVLWPPILGKPDSYFGGVWCDRIEVEALAVRVPPVAWEATASPVRASPTRPSRGRRPGSGSLAALDAPLVAEMKRLIDSRTAPSVHAAAFAVVQNARGSGTDKSRVHRLIKRFNATHPSYFDQI